MSAPPFPAVAQRRAGVPWIVVGLAAAALATLLAIDASPYGRFLHHEYQPASVVGQLVALALFLCGWALMMLAMMLPTATSLLAATARLAADRGSARRLQVFAAAGFMSAWLATGYVFRAGDVLVHSLVGAIGWLEARPQLVGASTLLIAGAFQFSSMKRRCLTACRSPSGFVYRHWHGTHPVRDATRIGVAYGMSCVGCCWALMLVMFGLGTANVAWMLALGAVTAAEKHSRLGRRASAPVGLALILAAIWVAMR